MSPDEMMMTEGPMDLPAPDPMSVPLSAEGPTFEGEKVMDRDPPQVDAKRSALVNSMTNMVKLAKDHWKTRFDEMERDARFCAGQQWREETKSALFNDGLDDRYVANITLRHIQQKVASLYAKNPRATARRRQKLLSTVWDGTAQSLQQAQQTMQQKAMADQAMMAMGMSLATGAPMPGQAPPAPGPGGAPGAPAPMGMPVMPPSEAELANAQEILADAQNVKAQLDLMNRMGRTLEILYQYEVDEQQQPFKSRLKEVVRRAATTGVGWVKLGFQRVMGKSPDFDTRIADVQQRLSTLERISADIADGETHPDEAEAEQLRLLLEDMQRDAEVIVREGLQFSYPKPNAIIPDPRTVQLRNFLGADWVAEEFLLTVDEIKETYGKDVGTAHATYEREDVGADYERARAIWARGGDGQDEADKDRACAMVWEIYNKKDGLVYVVCDGYPDFLREPAAPDIYTDRFWPWFLVAFNETYGRVYPLSDVQLIRGMQLEINRSRQGLREHRMANRPKVVYAEGMLGEDDLDALKNHPVNALIGLSGLQPGQDVKQLLQAFTGAPIDPNVYSVESVFQDLLRVSGDQEANLGGTAGNTATETNVAQASRATAIGSSVDDLDDTLTEIAKAAGQILLLNVSEETVKEIVGPGAVWPTLTKAEVARDLSLEIKAGSSGRPNQAQELQNFERLGPIMLQIPGVSPIFMAKEAIRRLDDRLDPEEAVIEGMPSIQSMNGAKGMSPMPGPGGAAPDAQGPAGGNNAPAPKGPNPSAPTPKPPPGPGGPGM